MMSIIRVRWLICASLFLLLSMAVQKAEAAWGHCRSDPVVILSNGMVLDLSADISVLPMRVQRVDYILHGPADVSLVASVKTTLWPLTRETFTYIADSPPGQYHTETVVYTRNGNASVTAHTVLVSVTGLHLDAGSADGVEAQTLHVYLDVP